MKQSFSSCFYGHYLVIAALALSSCAPLSSLFGGDQQKSTHNKQRIHSDADIFVENLSLSRIALAESPPDTEDASGYLTFVKSYDTYKHSKAKKLTLVVIDYKMSGESLVRRVIAPLNGKDGEFPALQSIMDKLDSTSSVLQNTHLVSAIVTPDKSFVIPEEPAKITEALDHQQQRLLEQSRNLALADDIRTQLALMDFFTKHHFQDAAYLSLDNVKRTLATASQNKSLDDNALAGFSAQLEAQESALKTELPYKF